MKPLFVDTWLVCLLLLLMGLVSACKVGPRYVPPSSPLPPSFSEEREGKTQLVNDEDLCRWWQIFDDPFLNALLDEAIHNSFDYRIALENILQARAQYRIQFAQILPDFEGTFEATRYRTSQSFANAPSAAAAGLSPIQNFFQAGFDAIWQLDLFGQLRNSAEAAYHIWQATDEEANAVKIVVLSEVANTYTSICALQKQRTIAQDEISVDSELFILARERFQAGLSDEQEVEAARSTLETDLAALQEIDTSLKVAIYSLATLLGRPPETLVNNFMEPREIPKSDGRVPAGLPSDLLRRRPDIRSAERNLAAATNEIGVAVAALFPQINLIGSSSSFAANPLQGANIGFTSDNISKLFTPASRIWGIGGLVTFPVFDFGKRLAGIDLQVSLRNQAYLAYQKTVIQALEETEQALAAYFNDQIRVLNLGAAAAAGLKNVVLMSDLYQSGLADYTQVLQAKKTWLASESLLTDSRKAMTTDLIALYKSLGGDW